MPSLAEAYVNLRIHSAQSLQEVVSSCVSFFEIFVTSLHEYYELDVCCHVQVLDLVQSTVGDQRVKVELIDGFDPLPVSSMDDKSFGFQIIKKTVLEMFPTVTVAPGRIKPNVNV